MSRLIPAVHELAAGSVLARVYFSRGPYPLAWNEFRRFGPVNSRWDHLLPNELGQPQLQDRGIYDAAADARTCLAEVFQATRRIDRAYQAPWLVIWKTHARLRLLDLTGDFATRMGASMAIHSGSRVRARGWASDLHRAFGQFQGILYASSMHGGARAIALNERALESPLLPPNPEFHRALADDVLVDPLKIAADALGYALR